MANTSRQHNIRHSHNTTATNTQTYKKRSRPHLFTARLLYLHNASTSLRSSTSTVGIGRNHPLRGLEEFTRFLLHLTSQAGRGTLAAPAVQEAVRLGRQMWGLEEFTCIWHSQAACPARPFPQQGEFTQGGRGLSHACRSLGMCHAAGLFSCPDQHHHHIHQAGHDASRQQRCPVSSIS